MDLHRVVVGGPRRGLGPGSLRLARHHRARFAQARGLRQQDLPTDYLALVLSWSPEHCETQRNRPEGQRQKQSFQCFSGNRFEWVVHGLWPQNGQARSGRDHPRNCEAAGAVPASVLKQHLCMMPGVELMQNEWQAHGTCGWRSPERYFADIQAVYGTLHRPTVRDMAGKSADLSPNRLLDATAGTSSRPSCGSTRRCRQTACASAWPRTTGSGNCGSAWAGSEADGMPDARDARWAADQDQDANAVTRRRSWRRVCQAHLA